MVKNTGTKACLPASCPVLPNFMTSGSARPLVTFDFFGPDVHAFVWIVGEFRPAMGRALTEKVSDSPGFHSLSHETVVLRAT